MNIKINLTATLLIVLVAFVAGALETTRPRESNDGLQMIKTHCAAEWPSDYRMQEHCVRTQIEAADDVRAWLERYFPARMSDEYSAAGPEEQARILGLAEAREPERAAIANTCTREWSPPEWRMIRHCIERQEEALTELQR